MEWVNYMNNVILQFLKFSPNIKNFVRNILKINVSLKLYFQLTYCQFFFEIYLKYEIILGENFFLATLL